MSSLKFLSVAWEFWMLGCQMTRSLLYTGMSLPPNKHKLISWYLFNKQVGLAVALDLYSGCIWLDSWPEHQLCLLKNLPQSFYAYFGVEPSLGHNHFLLFTSWLFSYSTIQHYSLPHTAAVQSVATGLDIGFIDHLYTRLLNTSNYSATINLHKSRITTAPAKPFPASVSSPVVPWQRLLTEEILQLHALRSSLHRLPYRTQ
jgi:hypothetical protein